MGGYSTIWLVYDSTLTQLATLIVVVSELSEKSNEVRALQLLASFPSTRDGPRHLRKLTDHFLYDGPNGRHQCLGFDVDGVSVATLVTRYGSDARLPGRLAWQLSKQITLVLDRLHLNGIAHGDLYTGNMLDSQIELRRGGRSRIRINPPLTLPWS